MMYIKSMIKQVEVLVWKKDLLLVMTGLKLNKLFLSRLACMNAWQGPLARQSVQLLNDGQMSELWFTSS